MMAVLYVLIDEGLIVIACARDRGDITPCVVSLLSGVWVVFDSEGFETAGSVNVLTSTVPTTPCYGSLTHSFFVQVKKTRGLDSENRTTPCFLLVFDFTSLCWR